MSATAIASVLRQTIEGAALGVPIIHDNSPGKDPESGQWVRFKVKADDAEQISAGGVRKSRVSGVAEAWVYDELEKGDNAANTIAEAIADAFRGGTVDPVVFREPPTVKPQGREGRWWAVLVLIPYIADESIAVPAVPTVAPPAIDLVGVNEIASIVRVRAEASFPATTFIHDNENEKEPESGTWVRLSIQVGKTGQVQMGGTLARYRTAGMVFFQVFSELEIGDNSGNALADSIADVFRSVTVNPVVFKSPTVSTPTRSRASRWWQVLVSVPYHADRLLAGSVAPLAPTIVSAEPVDGVDGSYYQHLYKAAGTTPITWSVFSGSLPTGLALDTTTGSLSGTPVGTGTFVFTVRATNAHGTDDQATSVDIAAAAGSVQHPPGVCLSGTGTPRGVVSALFCSEYFQTDGDVWWRQIAIPSGTNWVVT